MTLTLPPRSAAGSEPHNSRDSYVKDHSDLAEAAEQRAAARQHPQGKLTARERIDALLDPMSFVEVGQFAGGNPSKGFLGAAVVTGHGTIAGRRVAVYAQDFSVRGGTLGRVEGDKILHLMDIALEMKIPVIALLDSGGARIQEGVVALGQYGRIFRKTCAASGVIPQISLILGPCAGGAVYCPALTDFIIMTRDNSHMFVTGPDVVRAVTGENVSFEELGGGELHNFQSGVAHYLADSEQDALDYTRALLSYLPSNCDEAPPSYAYEETAQELVNAQSLDALVPASSRQPYDMVEVIRNLVDHGEFVEVQEMFARNVVVGFACMNGEPVGIVANQPLFDAGTLDVDASEKAARFVRFLDAFGIPIVTLVDVPGYRPGTEQEQAGIIRRGAKLIFAYANATSPMVTVVLRKAYGGAYIVMGSKSIGADFNFAWPGSEIAVMGADGAVSIMYRRELAAAVEAGRDIDEVSAELAAKYTEETINPNLSVEEGEFDAIITPSQTRSSIVSSLALLATKDTSHVGVKRHDNGPL
ncbi:acyl-CoA carboxylase subunit beta [Actinomycetaceae bacterium WB03_NA08]|uniref:Acyl-CoA carboxylase subunit beta n=1 Tax=Scrofimicrobium canadense TaxID=2652290 RepID=A0A6N7VVA8_9ACTO|nr:acyl-CoA carboxylase subunit beta [Scrofimicrobium canadense]MSS84920.1 acyl-CoA carboxylase subunit beta [Scrofimicrobium canadense]